MLGLVTEVVDEPGHRRRLSSIAFYKSPCMRLLPHPKSGDSCAIGRKQISTILATSFKPELLRPSPKFHQRNSPYEWI